MRRSKRSSERGNDMNKRFERIAAAFALTRLFAACSPWGSFDNAGDPKADNYQGYDTIADAEDIQPVSSGGGTTSLFMPKLLALKVAGAERYHFQVAEDAAYAFIAHENIAVATNEYLPLGWTDPKTGITYYWRVRAYKGGNWGSWSTNLATFGMTTPSSGTTIPAQGATTTLARPDLDWGDVAEASSYRVQIATTIDFAAPLVDAAGLPTSSYTPTAKLDDGLTYYWRIAAKSAAGGGSAFSLPRTFVVDYPLAATPTFSIAEGTYSTDQSVALASSGASIYYTLDGTAPTTGSTLYELPIPVAGHGTVLTINALADSDTTKNSTVASATYTISYPAAATPLISPEGGYTVSNPTIAISCATPGYEIRYTTNGIDPTKASSLFSAAFSVTVNPATTVKAIAFAPGCSASAIATMTYRDYYAIGDTGPAGGLIFYDKGSYSGSPSWRYLEAAPTDQMTSEPSYLIEVALFIQSSLRWGLWGGPGTAIGTGASNTAAIVADNGRSGEYAALICDNLVLGGCSDWFLPSKDELHLMYTNLHLNGRGGFGLQEYTSFRYLSSSETADHHAWTEYFNDGTQTQWDTYINSYVRAARAF
jgi:hypothetical protein